jgi:hypothetical protein
MSSWRNSGIHRSADISAGWRRRDRSLSTNTAPPPPKAGISGDVLCSMNFEYPKIRRRKCRDRLRFRGDRFECGGEATAAARLFARRAGGRTAESQS